MKYVFVLFTFIVVHSLHGQTEFSQENATVLLKYLSVDIGPRPMGSPAEHHAMNFAIGKFKEYGCDTAYIMPMTATGRVNTNSGIAIGIKRGATKRIILIGGHIDSEGPEVPGADDDGSGSATVMECARVLGKRSLQSTIVFCCWGGEEQGLEGSKYFVNHYADLDSVALMLQVDMANGPELIELDPDTHGHSAPRWLTRAAIEEFYALGYEHLRYPTHFLSLNYAGNSGSGSDHESFLRQGIPAIDFSTDVSKPIHTPRDNFENFDPRGLKRSGDVILKLVERFDGGVPSRETERYWLYLVGSIPMFIPFWGIWTFLVITLLIAVIAFVSVRARREPPNFPERIQWSGLKMLLCSFIIVTCGWFSSDIIGMIIGVRHPWMTAIPSYYLLAFFAIVVGVCIALRVGKKLTLSRCPYVYFKRSAILLILGTILFGLINIKLTIEPAVALFFISLAMLVRQPIIRCFFLLLSPWWLLRIVFSEWSPLVFRSVATGLPSDTGTWLFIDGLAIIFFSLYLLPLLFGAGAIIRDSPSLNRLIPKLLSRKAFVIAVTAFVAWGAYAATLPVYDQFWYKDVHLTERYDMNDHTKEVAIDAGEYLNGLRITHGGKDSLIEERVTKVTLTPVAFDTTWFSVGRNASKQQMGDTTTYNVELRLTSFRRPFTISVSYSTRREDQLQSFDTKLLFRNDKGTRRIEWYSFPDTVLNVPVEFQITGNDSVREKIEVTFDRLADPIDAQGELSYFLPRTTYVNTFVYKK